jgi:hypothetical protein
MVARRSRTLHRDWLRWIDRDGHLSGESRLASLLYRSLKLSTRTTRSDVLLGRDASDDLLLARRSTEGDDDGSCFYHYILYDHPFVLIRHSPEPGLTRCRSIQVTLWTVSSAATDIVLSAVSRLDFRFRFRFRFRLSVTTPVRLKRLSALFQVLVFSLRRVKTEFASTDGCALPLPLPPIPFLPSSSSLPLPPFLRSMSDIEAEQDLYSSSFQSCPQARDARDRLWRLLGKRCRPRLRLLPCSSSDEPRDHVGHDVGSCKLYLLSRVVCPLVVCDPDSSSPFSLSRSTPLPVSFSSLSSLLSSPSLEACGPTRPCVLALSPSTFFL